jgi:sugar diacid utilization regulator
LVGVSRCSVFLRGDDGYFHGRVTHAPAVGSSDDVKSLVAGLESDWFTRDVMSRQRAILVRDLAKDRRAMPQNMRSWHVRDLLGIPLLVDDDVIGVMYLDNLGEEHVYTDAEIAAAERFARLAAVVVRGAWPSVDSFQRSSIIERQRNSLARLSHIHAELTEAVVSGADVPSIVKRVAGLVGKPATVYNENFVQVCSAFPEQSAVQRLPLPQTEARASTWFRRQLAELREGRSSILVPPSPDLGFTARRIISHIRVDGAIAGYLEVLEIGQKISTLDVKVAEHGATVLSLAMLSERRAVAAAGLAAEDLFGDLLRGTRDHATLTRRALLFGLDLDMAHAICHVGYMANAKRVVGRSDRREAVTRLITRDAEVSCVASLGTPNADVFLLGPISDPTLSGMEQLRLDLEHAFQEGGGPLEVGVSVLSRVCTQVEHYEVVNSEVEETLALIEALGPGPRIKVEGDIGVTRLLATHSQIESAVKFATDLLKPIVDQEGSKGELVGTLRAYLGNDGSIRATAASLDVHENTVRYRLARVRGLSRIDTDRLDHLLDLRFALRIFDLVSR